LRRKLVYWIGSSRDDLRDLPQDVCDEFGFALYQLQLGEMPAIAKPMHGPLRDVLELVVSDRGSTYWQRRDYPDPSGGIKMTPALVTPICGISL